MVHEMVHVELLVYHMAWLEHEHTAEGPAYELQVFVE
jgi:hypothetical protein